MSDDVRVSVLRRKLVAAIGGLTASAVARAAPASAQDRHNARRPSQICGVPRASGMETITTGHF